MGNSLERFYAMIEAEKKKREKELAFQERQKKFREKEKSKCEE